MFFSFFIMLILQVVRRVKGQNMAQNDKKLCLPCLVSQEAYIIWSSFMLLMCKRIISPGFFSNFFQILILGVKSELKGQKMAQHDKKICLSHSIFQETSIIWLWFFGTRVKWRHLQMLSSFFQNFNFPGFSGDKRANNGQKRQKIMSVSVHISGTVLYYCGFW